MNGFSMARRRSLGVGRRALLNQNADLLGLGLEGGELGLEELALQREGLLRILGLNQLVGEIERCVDVLLGVTQRLCADRFGVFLRGFGGVVGGADCLLGDGNEALERLARLVDAAFGKITQFVGYLNRGLVMAGLACGVLSSKVLVGAVIEQSLLHCNIILQCNTR